MRCGLVAVVTVGVLTVGCGSQVSTAPGPPAVGDASRVDMCTILSDGELSELGIKPDTRITFDEAGVTGCQWAGEPFTVSLDRDDDPLASYLARRREPAFVSFADNTVRGRAGAQLVLDRGGSQCTQLMDGGPVTLTVSVVASSALGPSIDACAEALRIAQMIEPRLPDAAS